MGEHTESIIEEQITDQTDNLVASIEATEKGYISYTESYLPSEVAGQESDNELDMEWAKQKKVLFEHLKQINDEIFNISRDLSTLGTLTIKLFRKELINMAALIEKELLRRGEEF